MDAIKKIIKSALPSPVRQAIQEYRSRNIFSEYSKLTTQQAFKKIYAEGAWGRSDDPSQRFFSGNGSHDTVITATYIEAIREFLSSLDKKPDVADLGCGDFFIGSNVRSLCGRYAACDVVPELIEFNKERFKSLDVDFRVVDIAAGDLPPADIVFVRQVFQHLSNAQIMGALPRISSAYKYLVLSEHLPDTEKFVHNVDKRTGPHIRLNSGSGVVLTSPPFNLKVKEERLLCQVPELGGIIKTTLYRLS